jgi:hypothetical protein
MYTTGELFALLPALLPCGGVESAPEIISYSFEQLMLCDKISPHSPDFTDALSH